MCVHVCIYSSLSLSPSPVSAVFTVVLTSSSVYSACRTALSQHVFPTLLSPVGMDWVCCVVVLLSPVGMDWVCCVVLL